MCSQSMPVCVRAGVRGFPTISVLRGGHVYDYQGKLSVEHLSGFVSQEVFLKRSKARRLRHVTSPMENLELAMREFGMKLRKITMLIF